MASENSADVLQSLLESLLSPRNRNASLLFPFFAGLRFENPSQEQESEGEDTPTENQPYRFILINPFTQRMVVIENSNSLSGHDSFFDDLLSEKRGLPPASKASIDSMETIEVSESGDQCVICLEDWEIGEKATKMPCNHRFHGKCVEKWLNIHGSCPVCRYEMPVDEDEAEKKTVSGESEGVRRSTVWLSFLLNGDRRNEETDQTQTSESESHI